MSDLSAKCVSTDCSCSPPTSTAAIGSFPKTIRTSPCAIRQSNYVVGAIHTNTIEGFWSIMKRGVMGTFHKVSRKYLPLYVAEFQFRYNNRTNSDIFGTAVSAL